MTAPVRPDQAAVAEAVAVLRREVAELRYLANDNRNVAHVHVRPDAAKRLLETAARFDAKATSLEAVALWLEGGA